MARSGTCEKRVAASSPERRRVPRRTHPFRRQVDYRNQGRGGRHLGSGRGHHVNRRSSTRLRQHPSINGSPRKVVGSRIRHDLDAKKKDHLKKVAESLSAAKDEPTSMGARLARCIENGAAFHNAGLTNPQRAIVEKEFRKGRLACIVATPTLAAGINL